MNLSKLPIGSTATIQSVGGSGALRQHFLDMGLIQGTEVTVVKYAPMGDPIELRIHGYELSIRLADAENIQVGEAHEPKTVENAYWVSIIPSLPLLKELVVRILNTVKFNTIKVSINTLIIAASPWQ